MRIATAFFALGLVAFSHQGLAVTKTLSSAPVGSEGAIGGAAVTCHIYNAGTDPVVLKPASDTRRHRSARYHQHGFVRGRAAVAET